MRYLVSPEFSEKVVLLTPASISEIAIALKQMESSTLPELISRGSVSSLSSPASLFVMRQAGTRIFFSIGHDSHGEYALLVDVAVRADHDGVSSHSDFSGLIRPHRDPKTHGRLNPKTNGQINPKFNGKINPKINGKINPKFNGKISPKFNGQINPKFNGRINPKFNGQINPRLNGRINPKINWSINPKGNAVLSSLIIYNIDLTQAGYTVSANDTVLLQFDLKDEWVNFLVAHSMTGFVQFNPDGEWTGHWESNGQDGYNIFDLNNEWVGFAL